MSTPPVVAPTPPKRYAGGMANDIIGVFTVALIITAVGIALRPGAPTADVIQKLFTGFSQVQTAAFGPK